MKKDTYLIGGIDSFGVPYTRDNKNNINHLKVVFDFFKENIDNLKMIDMYSMSTYNDTDYLSSILKDNTSLYEIKQNQRKSITLCRNSGIFQFIQLPDKTRELYHLNDNDKNEKIVDILSNNNIAFIYSCGVNDFLKNMDTNLAKMLNTKEMARSFENIDATIKLVIDKIENNIKALLKINPELELYIMSIYTPTRVKYIRKRVQYPIELYNEALKQLCSKYEQVYFIDNSNLTKDNMAHVDWHPNLSGQLLMGQNIITGMKNNSKILNLKK